MAGLMRDEDVALVKERTSIEDVVRAHVTLTRAGTGSLKGLCPFHDERTPSFHVRPAHGHWHCFGCGEGGDVISFVEKIEHLSFVEAVERLAGAAGVEVRREAGGADEASRSRRTRLLEAHRAAAEFYASALLESPEARSGRDFLRSRGFDSEAASRFGVGYAPKAGDTLTRHLMGRGFDEDELMVGGLSGRSSRGLYDRFRGRVMWPVRDVTGATVGFGARRLYDDDRIAAKYLNTAESPIYKKTSLLYGIDLAKGAIAKTRQAVVVEGYTDVMAMHLAGVETAVATCGTAFGVDHVKVLRRLLRDDGSARTVFTFDGDAAGQKAAMRAFELDDSFNSASYVAVAADGLDPCDLRLKSGDAALELLVSKAVPMFEFAARTKIEAFDLTTAEGQAGAVHEVAPILAGIGDQTLRHLYLGRVATWIGVEIDLLARAVNEAIRAGRKPTAASARSGRAAQTQGQNARQGYGSGGGPGSGSGDARGTAAESQQNEDDGDAAEQVVVYPRPDLSDRVVSLEHQVLQVLLQHPAALRDADILALVSATFVDPGHAAVLLAALSHWGEHTQLSSSAWVDLVQSEAGDPALRLVSELSVAPIRARHDPETGRPDNRYVSSLIVGIQEVTLRARISEAAGALRRAEAVDAEQARGIAWELRDLQQQLESLKESVQ
ncbi:MAG: DNA primase [Dermatophilus congolensis]|nr:DNA primase [Dermatophilus congolensis]